MLGSYFRHFFKFLNALKSAHSITFHALQMEGLRFMKLLAKLTNYFAIIIAASAIEGKCMARPKIVVIDIIRCVCVFSCTLL